ncbi:sigma-54-dependent transcriptional regulator [Bacteroidota bacterium]
MIKKKGKILIIDDNKEILNSLELFLKRSYNIITTVSNPNLIPNIMAEDSYDVILLDMNFKAGVSSGNEGIFWLHEIQKYDPEAIVIMITAYGDIELAVKTLKNGAFDFIVKPWDTNKLLATIKAGFQLNESKKEIQLLKNKQEVLQDDLNKQHTLILGSSPSMASLMDTVRKVAQTEANILILGENGTGKELIARELHRLSDRSNEIFVGVDLSALNENLIESELFGHIKGSFTGATDNRAGRFESASGGTLFLDEIGNLSLNLQTKLLTAIQNKEINRIGSDKPIPVDIRIISATNKSLYKLQKEGLFREDLLYRINTIQLDVPALAERSEDILAIAEYYVDRYSRKYEKPNLKITDQAISKLFSHNWPGNIRELKHMIEKAVILSNSSVLKQEDFIFQKGDQISSIDNIFNLDEVEKHTIDKVIKKNKGNLRKSAAELGVSRTTLYAKISKYDL